MMTGGWMSRVLLVVAAVVASGCAAELDLVERTTHGPTAEELMLARSVAINGRAPSFEERRYWEREVEERVYAYLRDHPELQQSPRYTEFRFLWQVTPASTAAEVRVLLQEPQERTVDPARMAALAARHWGEMRSKVKEAWVYEPAWTIYFDDKGVVAIVHRVSSITPRE
jgi:hypothetical protein